MKLFASVRVEDTELYLALLGELPRLIPGSPASSACEVLRVLARIRLRERSYVEMLCAHILQFLRNQCDTVIPARLFVKTGNALGALDVRTHAKFLTGFMNHFEYRIAEFNAELLEQFSPIFVIQFMNDEARKVFLCRAAEVQAGFHGRTSRNLAAIEFAIRREHHSLVSTLPSYVPRYLEKIKHMATLNREGFMHLQSTAVSRRVAQSGKMGQSAEAQLQAKITTAARTQPKMPGMGSQSVDVWSSGMHEDVSACLGYLGIVHENGVPAGPFLLDVVAENPDVPDHRVVYEVNSKHNYYLGTQLLTAEKRFRHRMLSRLGYCGTHLSFHEWHHLSPAQRVSALLEMQQRACESGAVNQRRARGQLRRGQQPRPAELAPTQPVSKPGHKLPAIPRIGLPDPGVRAAVGGGPLPPRVV